MRRVVVACALIAGCGRFGFDGDATTLDAMGDTSPDGNAPLTAFELTLAAPFSTTSTTFVDIPGATLTLPPSKGTSWLVMITAQLESPTLSAASVEAQCLLDGVAIGMGGTQTSTPGHPGPWQQFAIVGGKVVPQQLSFQLRDASGAGGIMSSLAVQAIPLAPSDIAYATNDPPHDVTTALPTADTTLSLGTLNGDYVIMLVVNTTDLPAQSDCYVQWRGPGGEVWLPDLQQPRESWQSFMTVRRETLDVPNAQVTLLTHYGSTAPCQVRQARALAIRATAFGSVDYARSDTFIATASMFPATTVTLPGPSSQATQLLYWGNAILDEDCNTVADALRTVTFTRDASATMISHATDNCSYTATYGTSALLTSAPQTMTLAVSSGSGTGVVEHFASELLLLGLR